MSKLFDYKFVSPILTFSIQPVQLCMHVWNVLSQLWKMWHNLKEHIENIDLPNEAAALKNIIVSNFIINNDKFLLHKWSVWGLHNMWFLRTFSPYSCNQIGSHSMCSHCLTYNYFELPTLQIDTDCSNRRGGKKNDGTNWDDTISTLRMLSLVIRLRSLLFTFCAKHNASNWNWLVLRLIRFDYILNSAIFHLFPSQLRRLFFPSQWRDWLREPDRERQRANEERKLNEPVEMRLLVLHRYVG